MFKIAASSTEHFDPREWLSILWRIPHNIERDPEKITSPFISQFSHSYQSLSPTEVNICNMIKNGMRTKEIAQLRGVSVATINRHREHIRRKLKITNSEVNLTTYLQSIR